MKNIPKNIMIIIISIIIISILHYIYTRIHTRYRIWANIRPVYIDSSKKHGVITNKDNFKDYVLPRYCTKKIFTQSELPILIDFINTHFEGEESTMTVSYVTWHLDNMIENKLMFGLEYDNILCGVIAGNVIYINVDNKIYKSLYIDYLCITKTHRSKKYASVLFSFILNAGKQNNCDVFLFKKDTTQYYFNHIYSSYYYILKTHKYTSRPIQTNNHTIDIKELDKELKNDDQLILELYNMYHTYSGKYRIYEHIYLKHFTSKLLDKTVLVLVFYINKKISGYVVLTRRYYTHFKDTAYEIYHFIILNDSIDIQILTSLINDELMKYMKSNNIKYVISSLNPSTAHIIKYFNMKKCTRVYYYLYNYNIPGIKPSDILILY